jgi:hypothetical protein
LARKKRFDVGFERSKVAVQSGTDMKRLLTVRVDQRLVADGSELIEFICHENQQFMKRVKVD